MTPSKTSLREPLYLFLTALAVRSVLVVGTDNNCTDAMARHEIAEAWAAAPWSLPSQVWLPLHFWLLGSLHWLWPGELASRFATVVVGAATVLPFYGIARAGFGRDVALYATLTYAFLGLHLAQSACSSSEAPTLLFLLSGVYCWARFRRAPDWRWILAGGSAMSAACLIRFEPWLMVAAAVALLLVPPGERSDWLSSRRWLGVAGFGLVAGAGMIGWVTFSVLAWGDPLAAPNRTFVQNATDVLKVQHSLSYRLAVVPGALVVSLSPFIALCALPGAFRALRRPRSLPASLVVLALVGGGAHFYYAVTRDVTQARYTLMYSWLLVPLAYEGLLALGRAGSGEIPRRAFTWLLAGFLVWQIGIVIGAHRGPPPLADKLSAVSATMPLSVEQRELIGWLRGNVRPGEPVILDDFNYDYVYILRDALRPEDVMLVPRGDQDLVEARIGRFLEDRRPKFLVYCELGQLGVLWRLPDGAHMTPSTPPLTLQELWRAGSYRVYRIGPEGSAPR